jgi:hypothetical protein
MTPNGIERANRDARQYQRNRIGSENASVAGAEWEPTPTEKRHCDADATNEKSDNRKYQSAERAVSNAL